MNREGEKQLGNGDLSQDPANRPGAQPGSVITATAAPPRASASTTLQPRLSTNDQAAHASEAGAGQTREHQSRADPRRPEPQSTQKLGPDQLHVTFSAAESMNAQEEQKHSTVIAGVSSSGPTGTRNEEGEEPE